MSEELVRKLKEARERLGITQNEMSERLNISISTLRKWEQDAATPRGFALKALLETLEKMK